MILGSTGISVSEYALGAMMFGANGNRDHADCARIIGRALDAGINFVDTADLYGRGESEVIVGSALKGRREEVVLATKFGNRMGADDNARGGSRRWVIRAVEDSLRRLETDYIDLYQMHRPDPDTDIDETLSALSSLVQTGKVRAIGTSTFSADQIVEAQWCAERRGHVRPLTEQPPYSILARAVEGTTLPLAQKYGLGVLTWGPLGSGWLSGRPMSENKRTGWERVRFDMALPANISKAQAVEALAALGSESGISLPHLALAFVRAHPAVTSVIIGPRTMEQLEDLIVGLETTLDDDILDQIDQIAPPGIDFNRAENYYVENPAITHKGLRRRR
jgi:aryl-alcohol dehydrogenase-like predicted oxidoreductase